MSSLPVPHLSFSRVLHISQIFCELWLCSLPAHSLSSSQSKIWKFKQQSFIVGLCHLHGRHSLSRSGLDRASSRPAIRCVFLVTRATACIVTDRSSTLLTTENGVHGDLSCECYSHYHRQIHKWIHHFVCVCARACMHYLKYSYSRLSTHFKYAIHAALSLSLLNIFSYDCHVTRILRCLHSQL